MMRVLDNGTPNISSMMFDTEITEEFARFLVNSTNGMMSKALFYSSGKPAPGATWILLTPM